MFINTKTKLCGIVGYPIEHSLSPAIQNAAAQYHKINAVFLAFPTRDAKGAAAAMRVLGILDLTVTMPLKEKIMPYLDEIEAHAMVLGNINTVINKGGKLKGYNTDIDGIGLSLGGLRLKNRRVLLLGAGGAAKTVAYVVNKRGGQLHILNRDIKPVKKLARLYNAKYGDLADIKTKIKEIKPYLIVNATPVGMKGFLSNKSLVPNNALEPNMIVFDLVYSPAQTKLIRDAMAKGCKTINGRAMFLAQGAKQFSLWSGKRAPLRVMERAFDQSLK
jgi:shikimate dehydrogenase